MVTTIWSPQYHVMPRQPRFVSTKLPCNRLKTRTKIRTQRADTSRWLTPWIFRHWTRKAEGTLTRDLITECAIVSSIPINFTYRSHGWITRRRDWFRIALPRAKWPISLWTRKMCPRLRMADHGDEFREQGEATASRDTDIVGLILMARASTIAKRVPWLGGHGPGTQNKCHPLPPQWPTRLLPPRGMVWPSRHSLHGGYMV